jgi:hypothetical protein
MSFDITKSTDTTDTIQYNYSPTMFYKSSIQSTPDTNGYLKTPFTAKSNQPNIAFSDCGYITTSLYIVSPIHSIAYVSYDAELIIKHQSLTNYSAPLYTCFLLKSGAAAETDIDGLIKGKDVELNLNNLLRPQKTIVFHDDRAKIIVFTTPIDIRTSSIRWKKCLPLSPYITDYSIFRAKPILGEPLVEGLADSGIPDLPIIDPSKMPDFISPIGGTASETMAELKKSGREGFEDLMPKTSNNVTIAGYCTPIDETDPSIQQTAGVIVPIESKMTSNNAANSSIKTLLNLFSFFVMVVAAVFIAPIAHRILIVELILENTRFSAQRKLNRAYTADIYTTALIFGFGVAFINYGIINNDSLASILGFDIVIFLLASILILQYTRIFNPKSYLGQFKDKRGVLPSFENMEFDMGFVIDNFVTLFWKQVPDPENPSKTKGKLQFGFIFMIILFGFLMFILKLFKVTGNSGKFFLTSIYFYIFLLAIYVMHLIGHYNNVKERMKQAVIKGTVVPSGKPSVQTQGSGGGGPVI